MKKLFKFILPSYAVFCLIFMYKDISEDIRTALTMWVQVLIPSLFPYLVLSQYISSSGIMSDIPVVGKLTGKLFSLSPGGVGVYICSLLCGYPSGALCTAELWRRKTIDTDEAERLIAFTNNASPVFLICAVGGGMLGNIKDGCALYIIQTLSALISGIWLSRGAHRTHSTVPAKTSSAGLVQCTERSINAMLAVGAYLVLTAAFGRMITAWTDNLSIKAAVHAALEITTGINLIITKLNTPLMFPLICACMSWSGVAVMMQIISVIPKEISSKKLIISKLMQCVLSFCMGYLYKAQSMPPIYVDNQSNMFRLSAAACCIIFALYLIRSIRSTSSL